MATLGETGPEARRILIPLIRSSDAQRREEKNARSKMGRAQTSAEVIDAFVDLMNLTPRGVSIMPAIQAAGQRLEIIDRQSPR